MTPDLLLWLTNGAFAIIGVLFWRTQNATDERLRASESRAEGLAKELSAMREQMAREYHSKTDLRELLQDIVAPINRAIESLQRDFNDALRKGWPGGGSKG